MVNDIAPRGIYPMLYAFFTSQGGLDRNATRRQVSAFINNGAHGVAVLGLATEVNKLADTERRQLVEWVSEELDGRLPLAVTVNGATVRAQVELAKFAKSFGASWVILQPPPTATSRKISSSGSSVRSPSASTCRWRFRTHRSTSASD